MLKLLEKPPFLTNFAPKPAFRVNIKHHKLFLKTYFDKNPPKIQFLIVCKQTPQTVLIKCGLKIDILGSTTVWYTTITVPITCFYINQVKYSDFFKLLTLRLNSSNLIFDKFAPNMYFGLNICTRNYYEFLFKLYYYYFKLY